MADMENFCNDLIIINLYFGCEKYRPKTAISQVQSPYYLGTTILVHHDCHGTVAASELLRPLRPRRLYSKKKRPTLVL